MLRVGLTGGIACGKSHVLRRLGERGCRTLDLDEVAREVTAPGSDALAEIAEAFGSGVLDGSGALDRAALAALVFGDEAARARLNGIVHPRVRASQALWAADHAAGADTVLVTDGALLIESGVHLRFDRLVVVHCAPELQLRRLRERDGLAERDARARIEAQLPSVEKRSFAHFEIDTSGSVADTELASDALWARLAPLAAGAGAGRRRADSLERLLGGLVHGPEAGARGLSPALLLERAAADQGLEMERLARILVPPSRQPWYRAASELEADLPACRLGVALAAWAELRRGADPEFLAAAAASVARLTHAERGEWTDACLVALVAQERAAGGTATGTEVVVERALPLAARFGGAPATGRLDATWAALGRFPSDPVAAGRLCASLGGDAPTAAALAGLGQDVGTLEPAEAWRERLRA